MRIRPVWRAATGCIREGNKSRRERRKERKTGEAKPKPFFSRSGLDSGQLLEVGTPVEVALDNHLQTISATAGLWGTRLGRSPRQAVLTYAVGMA